jgi:hypothetical protein
MLPHSEKLIENSSGKEELQVDLHQEVFAEPTNPQSKFFNGIFFSVAPLSSTPYKKSKSSLPSTF